MTTDRLLVQPGVLQAKASEIQAERKKISEALSTAMSEIQSLGATWDSAAADAYRTQFVRQNSELQNILSILDRHMNDLTSTAQTFSTNEQALATKHEALPVVNITQ